MLHIEKFGKGKTLVFLHGALVSSTMWINQIEYLKDYYQTVVIDLPEHGKSKHICINEYTVQEISKIVVDTLNSNGIDSFHICGHSLGGMVAQEIALTHPGRVKSLILAETSYGTKTNITDKAASILAEVFMKAISQKQLINMSCKQYGIINLFTKEYIRKEMSNFNSNNSRRIMRAALQYSSLDKLSKITNETLVLVSEFNKQTQAQARRMNLEIKNSKLIQVPASHHILNMDNPNFFNKEIYRFIKNVDADN